jgi:hypothetical protein
VSEKAPTWGWAGDKEVGWYSEANFSSKVRQRQHVVPWAKRFDTTPPSCRGRWEVEQMPTPSPKAVGSKPKKRNQTNHCGRAAHLHDDNSRAVRAPPHYVRVSGILQNGKGLRDEWGRCGPAARARVRRGGELAPLLGACFGCNRVPYPGRRRLRCDGSYHRNVRCALFLGGGCNTQLCSRRCIVHGKQHHAVNGSW